MSKYGLVFAKLNGMNLMKNSKRLFRKPNRLASVTENLRLAHQKSLPPLARKKKAKDAEEAKADFCLPAKVDRAQRDIFGATILPQNLSFENAKKLSDNLVRLEDIPLVDENEAAEAVAAEKLRTGKTGLPKDANRQRPGEGFEVAVVRGSPPARKRSPKNSAAELFLVADPYEQIPGPRVLRRFVSALKHCTRQLTVVSLFRLAKKKARAPFRAYGPIVKLPEILGGKIVLVSRPEHIFAVFEQDRRYPINSTLDSVLRCRLQRSGKGGRVGHHLGEEWEEAKKSMGASPMKELDKYFDGIDEAASKFVRRIRTIRNRQGEVPDDFLFEINKWSLECLCSVVFDKSFGFLDGESASWPSRRSQLLYSLTVATKNLCHLETGFQFWRFMNTSSLSSLGSACEILENIISEHVGQVQLGLIKRQENLNLGLADSARNASLIEGLLLRDDLSPDDIVDNILDTLLIGANTMSAALGFLFYHLSQNPRAQSELWREVKEILPEKYSRLEHEQLSSLRYLQACLKESLRLKMPMPMLARVLSQNVVLGNYQIPKGTFVLMTAQVEGMKEENFEDPAVFLPERWTDQDAAHPFVSLPTRNYYEDGVERRMAEASIWVCASQVTRHFSIEYLYGDVEATSTAISFPNKALRFTFADRRE